MNPDQFISDLRDGIQKLLPNEWASTALTIVVILIATIIVSMLLTKLIRRVLTNSNGLLPSSSIFVNLARVVVWVSSICIILSSCFNVNVSALITALGVGGIAVSLGFQNTLSNIISGLLITLTKLVEPGDYINVSSNQGVVHDVTWRHTSIVTPEGEWVLVPNSLINSNALTKMFPQDDIRIDISIRAAGESIDHRVMALEQAVDKAISKSALLKNSAKIVLRASEIKKPIDDSQTPEIHYMGVLCFSVGKGVHVKDMENEALEAMAPYAKRIDSDEREEASADIWAFHNQTAELKMQVSKRRRQEKRKKRSEGKKSNHKSVLSRQDKKIHEESAKTDTQAERSKSDDLKKTAVKNDRFESDEQKSSEAKSGAAQSDASKSAR